jgi:hypothetical protein
VSSQGSWPLQSLADASGYYFNGVLTRPDSVEGDRLKFRQTLEDLGIGAELEVLIGRIRAPGIFIGDPDFFSVDGSVSAACLTAANQQTVLRAVDPRLARLGIHEAD